MNDVIGSEIEGYVIHRILGRGGMGVVYEAEDVGLGKRVALKMIDPVYARDEQFLRRFQAEARALGRMNDPHIVGVFALRRTEAGSFIVMEYVDGGTLADRLSKGPVPVREALPLIKQMLIALGHAHALGVVHRDVKPSNMLLTRDGVVKVTDFGLAKLQQSQPAATVTQGAAGTLYYMSPEQVKALPTLDHRSDLYSLGMTMYEMLAGRLPFAKEQSEFAIMRAIVEEEALPPTKFRSDIPPALSNVVMKALAKDPDRRYADAGAMLAAVEAFERSQIAGRERRPDRSQDGTTTRFGRVRRLAVAAVVGVLIGLAALAAWISQRDVERDDDQIDPPPRVATLGIATSPLGAIVRLDGVDVGATPLTRSVEAADGGVRVQLELEGYDPVDTLLFLAPEESLSLAFVLRRPTETVDPEVPRPGTLAVSTVGEGAVRVNGQIVGSGARLSLAPGEHDVQCGAAPFDLSTRVAVRSGREQSVVCHFVASIGINSQTEDDGEFVSASILINGEDTDLVTPREVERGPGSYSITVRKFGYLALDEERLVIRPTLEPQAPRNLVFRLRPNV